MQMNKESVIFRKLLKNPIDLRNEDLYNYFSAVDLVRFVLKYSKTGVIEYDSNCIWMTSYGKTWVFINKGSIYLKEKVKSWEKIPPSMLKKGASRSLWLKILER